MKTVLPLAEARRVQSNIKRVKRTAWQKNFRQDSILPEGMPHRHSGMLFFCRDYEDPVCDVFSLSRRV